MRIKPSRMTKACLKAFHMVQIFDTKPRSRQQPMGSALNLDLDMAAKSAKRVVNGQI